MLGAAVAYNKDIRTIGYWLGVTDKGNLGQFKVVSNGSVDFDSRYWHSGHPLTASVPQAPIKNDKHGLKIFSKPLTYLAYPFCHIPIYKLRV